MLLFVGSVFAAPATEPAATLPADVSHSAPIVQSAGQQTLLIVPFTESAGANYPWIGIAIQQDLLADLSRATRAHVLAPATMPPAPDAASAVKAGREASATLVVYGQYQIIGDQARLTGQILDVNTEKPGGGFTATGTINDLFPMEDSVSSQLLRALPPGWLTISPPPADPGGQVSAAPSAAPVVPPPQTAPPFPQYYSYTYPDYVAPGSTYSYYYGDYPYYGYAVPYYGPDIWFVGGLDFYHHHYWDHGYGGRGLNYFDVPHGAGNAPSARPGGAGGGSHGGGGGGGGLHRR